MLQIENAACLSEERGSPKVYIVVPKKSKYVKVQVYNDDEEINSMCEEMGREELEMIIGYKNRSKYNFIT